MKKPADILKMFDAIAGKYDFLNNIISLGTHKFVKNSAISAVPLQEGMEILDLCTGTGDIAILISKKFKKQVSITGVDFSEKMLNIARKRAKKHENIKFIRSDALNLPFEDNSLDAVFISFGLRNLKDLNEGIFEMKRVVKPGGFVVNLDTGKPKGLIGTLFRFYFFNIVPFLGKICCGNFSAYRYLPESADKFPCQEKLVKAFEQAGFREVRNCNFLFGAMAQQVAKK